MSGHGGGGRKKRGGHGGGGGGGGGHGGDSRWLVTYADLLTVLMALFLVLWTLSTIDLNKFKKFTQGLGDFGNPAAQQVPSISDASPGAATDQPSDSTVAGTTTSTEAPPDTTDDSTPPITDTAGGAGNGPDLTITELEGIAGKLQTDLVAHNIPATDGAIRLEDRGLIVSIQTDGVLFTSGSSAMTDSGHAILAAIAPSLVDIGNKILVEGHTDSRPLTGHPGYDNWNLSTDRALSVLKVLRDQFGLQPARLGATGYADQRPVDTGTTPDALARNRRVEIVVVAAKKPSTSTPAATDPNAPTYGTDTATSGDSASAETAAGDTKSSTPAAPAAKKSSGAGAAADAATPPSSETPRTTLGSEG